MAPSNRLNQADIKRIYSLRKQDMSVIKIAEKMRKSRCAIVDVVMHPEKYAPIMTPVRPSLTPLEVRVLLMAASSNSKLTPNQIAKKAGVTTTACTVKRLLRVRSVIKARKTLEAETEPEQHPNEASNKHLKLKAKWTKYWEVEKPLEVSKNLKTKPVSAA